LSSSTSFSFSLGGLGSSGSLEVVSVLTFVVGLSWNGELRHIFTEVILPLGSPPLLTGLEVLLGSLDIFIKSGGVGVWILHDLIPVLIELVWHWVSCI